MEVNVSLILYFILKCFDEKCVIECVYENLCFVEDLICLIVVDLVEFDWLDGFDIECCNEEFIY